MNKQLLTAEQSISLEKVQQLLQTGEITEPEGPGYRIIYGRLLQTSPYSRDEHK